MSRFRPAGGPPTRVSLDDATIDAIADRVADRVVARLQRVEAAASADAALAQAAMGSGGVSLSPELMRGLVRMVMDNLSAPDTGSVVDNLRGIGVLHPDGGLPLHQESARKG